MKNKLIFSLIFIIMFLQQNIFVFANEQNTNLEKLKEFNFSLEKLPENFKCNDIAELYSLYEKNIPLTKPEFETTDEYNKRFSKFINNEIYAFYIDPNIFFVRDHYITISPYNADNKSFIINIYSYPQTYFVYDKSISSIILSDSIAKNESDLKSNVFGAVIETNRTEGTQYGVAIINASEFGESIYHKDKRERNIKLEINMSADRAKLASGNLGVIVICRPIFSKINKEGNGIINEAFVNKPATFDDPKEYFFYRKFINVQILALWVYDIKSGEIFLKKEIHKIGTNT
jgi:hypothetical protein